jgi:PASTA domain-containing protein
VRGSRFLCSVLLATVATLIAAGPAAAASIWTPVASGTGGTISAIATPKAGEVVFTTTAGDIYYLAGGAFAKATLNTPAPLPFEDVAMSPEGTVGIAVGEGGEVYRSSNSGLNWTKLAVNAWTGLCGGGSLTAVTANLFSVHFAGGPNVIYITGANNTVLKSINGGATFNDVNKDSSSCLISESVGDTAWRDANTGFLLSNFFGGLWRTTDGLGGGVGATTKITEAVNGFEGVDRLALDADDPLRMWGTNPGVGPSYFQFTVNGGASWNAPTFTDGATATSFLDIASGIGTNVIAVGANGAIYTSTDGVNFSPNRADAPYTTNTWESVAFQPGSTTAWVGGTNGALLMTSQSNALPSAPITTPPAVTPPISTPPGGAKPKPRCKVPNLKGKSLKVAAKKLKVAHCALGKVTKKEGATAKNGKVTKASQKPGKSLPAGTKIKVTLAP